MNISKINLITFIHLFSILGVYALEFIELEILPGGSNAYPKAVTADGNYSVGSSDTGTGSSNAVRWSASGSVIDLGGGDAFDISNDGTIIVGCDMYEKPSFWRMTDLILNSFEINRYGHIYSVTANGDRAFGFIIDDVTYSAAEFDLIANTVNVFPELTSIIYDATPTGYFLVGEATVNNQRGAAFKAGTQDIEIFKFASTRPSGFGSYAYCVSDDGRMVVGRDGFDAVIWKDNASPECLGYTLDGTIDFNHVNISGDGRVIIVGNGISPGIVWANELGSQDLMALITSYGIDLSSYHMLKPTGISQNGDVIVGVIWEELGEEIPWMLKGFLGALPPEIRIIKTESGYQIHFRGILQESADMVNFTDVPSNPQSPYYLPEPILGKRFFRARSRVLE